MVHHISPRWLYLSDSTAWLCAHAVCGKLLRVVEPVCRPSLQRGTQRSRAPSRLSREVSAEEAFMLAHAAECAAEVARQPATGSVLHAACEKLRDEQRAAQKAASGQPCCVPSSPIDAEGAFTRAGVNKRGRRRSITEMPIPEGEELSAVHGICRPPMVSPEVLFRLQCLLTQVLLLLFCWCWVVCDFYSCKVLQPGCMCQSE